MNTPTLKELIEAKAHFGHRKALSVPQSKEFIFGIKNGINIINLEITQKKISEAMELITKLSREGKTIILVGTKKQAQKKILETTKEIGMPYINCRWLGGTLTNFETIGKRIKYYCDLEAKLASPEAKDYTKKERTMWEKELARLAKFFEGIKNLKNLPEAILVIDIASEQVAVREAKKMNVTVIGTGNTDSNPNQPDYFIPMNDNSELAINLICDLVKEAFKEGKNLKSKISNVKSTS